MTTPLGIRNNNPGNLRAGMRPWVGQHGVDSNGFCIFDTPEHGIRALALDLLNYEDKDNLVSLRQFINRWAPPEDNNDTAAYIAAICKATGFDADVTYDLHNVDNLEALTRAIIQHENGQQPYSDDQLELSVNSALGNMTGPISF